MNAQVTTNPVSTKSRILLYQQSTAYAIEALAFLAGLPDGTAVKVRHLSKVLEIPEPYLSKVMTQLAKRKYIRSLKGPHGGFSLQVDPEKVTLYRVMASLDSLTPLEENCVMGLKRCSKETPCAFHDKWSEFKDQAIAEAQHITLAELSRILLQKMRFRCDRESLTFQDLLKQNHFK
jgi:Rrf2 family protein